MSLFDTTIREESEKGGHSGAVVKIHFCNERTHIRADMRKPVSYYPIVTEGWMTITAHMGGRVHYQEVRDRRALRTLFGRGQTSNNNNKTNQQPSRNDLLPTARRYSSGTLAIFSQPPLKAVSVVRNVYYSNFTTLAAQAKAVIASRPQYTLQVCRLRLCRSTRYGSCDKVHRKRVHVQEDIPFVSRKGGGGYMEGKEPTKR